MAQEHKASNEEVMSMNEELQSTNEELETSKEELQSLNEELTTVNNQLHEKVQELETANNDISNLFNCTGIATVFLDPELRIRRFTPTATRLFKLIPTDVGRPLGDLGKRFTDDELLRDAREVQRVGSTSPREREVITEEGDWYARRIVPYRTLDNRIDGMVITFVDITERKQAADATDRRFTAIVESSADAIYSKDLDGTLRTWNAGAERLYGHAAEEALGQSIRLIIPDDRVGEWDDIMTRLVRGEPIEQLETERVRKDGKRIPVALTLSPLQDDRGDITGVSVTARSLAERKATEAALRVSRERLEAILNAAQDAIITSDRQGVIQSVNPSAETLFGHTADEMIGQKVSLLMASPYREEHDGYMARYLATGEKHIIGIGREVEAQHKDGSIFPVELQISEIEHLMLFTAVIHDISRRRKLEHEIVEIASLEQRRIGHDLHDSVGQEITALNFLVSDLAEVLQTEPSQATELVERLGGGVKRVQKELRNIMRGLLPVAVDSSGLMSALIDLVDGTRQQWKVVCKLDCPEPVTVEDNLVATHLYLIAQEAVHNALKHAGAGTIRISLTAGRRLSLSIRDDGSGMPEQPIEIAGLGLRIMKNRAAIIGATLTIEPAQPSGTLITCTLARRNHEREQDAAARPDPDRR